MNVIKEVNRSILQHYGNLVSSDEPSFDPESKRWIASLKADYPRIIQDECSNEKVVKFLSLNGLGILQFSEDLKLIESSSTSITDCVGKIETSLQIWQERAERIVTTASADNLARIGETQWVLAPIREIVSNLLRNDTILDSEINAPGVDLKLRQYFMLLEDLKLVSRVDKGYSYGNLFTILREKTQGNNIQEFKNAVLSCVIRERYSSLIEVFGIRQLMPFIHVESAYYRPMLEAEKLYYRKRESITNYCAQVYGYKDSLRLNYILDELVGSGALETRNHYVYGNEDIFSDMLEIKNEMIETNHRVC